jgi:Ca2+-binding RTX toxin-like protein
MRRPLLVLALIGALTALGGFPSTASAAAPANDNFAAAQALSGQSGEVVATNKEATKEIGEPAHGGNAGGASVWFHWTADQTGTLTVWTYKPSFDSLLAVYTGNSVNALTEVASNDDFGASNASRLSFTLVPGTEFWIAVDGVSGANGPFRLRWRESPPNDNFVDAELVAGLSGSAAGSTYGATAEPGEIVGSPSASVWYRWTAPQDGNFGFWNEWDRTVSIYTGSSVGTLTPAPSPGPVDEASSREGLALVAATSGTEYFIRVVGGFNWTLPFNLFWDQEPINDFFSDSVPIGGANGNVNGSTAFASAEDNEHARVGTCLDSVWYAWTAPTTGYVRFDTWGVRGDFGKPDTCLAAYSGADITTLHLLARNDDWGLTPLPGGRRGSAISFKANAGVTYAIAVSDFFPSWGPIVLRWYPGRIAFGSRGDDKMKGTAGRDYLSGVRGDDVILGLDGNDVVVGGPGNDRLFGGGGNDFLNSRDGTKRNDVVDGGPGADTVRKDRGDAVSNVP